MTVGEGVADWGGGDDERDGKYPGHDYCGEAARSAGTGAGATPAANLWSRLRTRRRPGRSRRRCDRHRQRAAGKPRLIAEVKRRSPSAGAIVENLDVATTVRAYEQAGAAAISVLTDVQFFGGSLGDLAAARAATALPILRKDFTVSTYQVFEARAAGADAILVIVAATEEDDIAEYVEGAAGLGMDTIVEVHTADELKMARRAGAKIIGINNRDLQILPRGPGYDGPTDGDGPAGDDHRQRERYPHGRRRAKGLMTRAPTPSSSARRCWPSALIRRQRSASF